MLCSLAEQMLLDELFYTFLFQRFSFDQGSQKHCGVFGVSPKVR